MNIDASVLSSTIRFLHHPSVFEFRPKPAEAFGAGERIPAKTSAEKLVLLFTFQAEAERFSIETAKFSSGFHLFSKSFGKS